MTRDIIQELDKLTDPNIGQLSEMSIERFARWYLRKMKVDYWEGRNPACRECGSRIERPEELRWYRGAVFHSSCFAGVYQKERGALVPKQREYYDLVLKINACVSQMELAF